MKKVIALLLVMAMVATVFAGCNTNKSQGEESSSPLETLQSPTEPPKTKTELALEDAVGAISASKVEFTELIVANGEASVAVTPNSVLNDFKSVISENSPNGVYECSDPDIVGIKERLSFKSVTNQESSKVYYWHFFADSNEDGSLKWVELDPLAGYDGSETITINGIGLNQTFADSTEKLGTPDYAGIDLRNGEEVIIMRWDYTIGDDSCVSIYICYTEVSDANIPAAVVHDIYVNMASNA